VDFSGQSAHEKSLDQFDRDFVYSLAAHHPDAPFFLFIYLRF